MKTRIPCRLAALVLALLMIVPMISIPSFAETTAMNSEIWDFENYETGHKITAADGATNVGGTTLMAFNKVLEDETGNRFWRVPIVASNLAKLNAQPTNRAGSITLPHAAFSTTEATSVSVDLDMNYLKGTAPNVGIWIFKVGYTDENGAAQTKSYVRLADVNLKTGELMFTNIANHTKTGAKGVVAGQWNNLEIVFYPQNGIFDVYVNGALYAYGCRFKDNNSVFVGTNFTVGANQVIVAVDSGNAADGYVTPDAAGENFENASYLDIDNLSVKTVTGQTGGALLKREGYESYKVGDAITLSGMPFNVAVDGKDGGSAIRVPLVTDGSNTNKGKLGTIGNPAIPTGKNVSFKVDMRPHAAEGDVNPLAGIWFHRVTYTPKDTATSKTQSYTRGLEFNLATGAINLTNAATGATRGSLTGAPGLIADEWNTVELILDTRDGSFTVLINDKVYLVNGYFYGMTGTDFSIAANTISYTICSSNATGNFTAVAEAGSNYENASYLDADNFTVTYDVADREAEKEWFYGFEDLADGTATKLSNLTTAATVVTENGDKVIKVPFEGAKRDTDGAINIDKNAYVSNFAFDYLSTPRLVIEENLFIPTEHTGGFDVRFASATVASFYPVGGGEALKNHGIVWLTLCKINYTAAGSTAILTAHTNKIGTTVNNVIKKGEWVNVAADIDMVNGTYDLYVDGELALADVVFIGQYNSGGWHTGEIRGISFPAGKFIFVSPYQNNNASEGNYVLVDDISFHTRAVETERERWGYGFEDLADGATTTLSNLGTAATVVTENGDKVIKIPFEGKSKHDAGNVNIDKNAYVSNPAFNPVSTPRLVIEEKLFIPAEHTGGFDIRFGGATAATFYPANGGDAVQNRPIDWPTLCRIDYTAAGSTAILSTNSNPIGTTVNNVIKKGEWVTVAADIDMVNGTYDLYVGGALALADVAFRAQYHANGNWHYGEIDGLSIPANKFIFLSPYQGNNASKGNYVLVDDISYHTYSMENKITGASVSLGEDLSVNYFLSVNKTVEEKGNLSMQFTVNGETVTVTDYKTVNGEYVFTLSGIAPQQMGDTIDAVAYADGIRIASYEDYSIKENLSNLLAKGAKGLGLTVEKYTAMKELISDLLTYGAAAQAYKNYNADAPVNAGVEGLDASARIPAASDNALKLNGNTDKGLYFKSATVRFDTVNTIRVKIVADAAKAENATVFVNGEAVALTELALINGEYYLDIEGITALDLDKTFEIILTDNDTVTALTYSVNTYVSAMLASESASAPMKDLALALYRYGMSAVAYAQN